MRSIIGNSDRSPLVALSILAILMAVLLGVAMPIDLEKALLVAVIEAAVLILFASGKLFDTLLWACPLVFLFAQFSTAALDLSRWCLLLLIVLLSGYLLRGQKLRATPVSTGLVLVALYAMATSFQSYFPSISFQKAISLLLFAGFLFFVPAAIQKFHPGLGTRKYVVRMYAWIAIATVLSNAVFVLIKPSAAFLAGRYRGWFVNPNAIGAVYGMFFIPVLAAEIGKHRRGLTRLASTCVFSLAAVGLLATQSRAGIAAGIISLAVLILPKRGLGIWVLVVGMTGIVILALFIGVPTSDIVHRLVYRNEVMLEGSGRFPVWAEIWRRFLDKPFLGSGLGVSETGLTPRVVEFSSAGYTIEKGNSYLGLLEELGAIGATVFIVALLVPILRACVRRLIRATSMTGKEDLCLVAVVMGGLANAIFEAWLLSVGSILGFSFWLFAALLMSQESD
jgi:O-antigen ligase